MELYNGFTVKEKIEYEKCKKEMKLSFVKKKKRKGKKKNSKYLI